MSATKKAADNQTSRIKSAFKLIDTRDVFVFAGFAMLFAGISCFSLPVALIVTGAIILLKGLFRWA